MRRLTALPALVVLLTMSAALADPPTLADLQQLWKQRDFAGVVKGASDALAPGGVTDPEDRFKIAWIKAEAQVQLRQSDEAVAAFNAAAKETDNPRQQAVATATAILIGRSKDFIYTSLTIKPPPAPKAAASKPPANVPGNAAIDADLAATKPTEAKPTEARPTRHIFVPPVVLPRNEFDVAQPLHRTDAMQAMWTDERLDAEQTIKAKIAAQSLPSINDALDRINAATPIAIAAGAADWPQTQKGRLANAARVDVNTAMKDMNTQLIAILKDQNKRRHGQHPKPMPQDQRNTLNTMTQTLDDITAALKALPDALSVDKDTYSSQLDEAARLEDRATTVLATD